MCPAKLGGITHYRGGHCQRRITQELWQRFFSTSSQWWDTGQQRRTKTQECLWLDSKFRPSWMEAALTTMASGAVQLDVSAWNERLAKYAKARQHKKTLELFRQMQREGVNPNKFSFVAILKACSRLRALEEGRCIHQYIRQNGLESDVYIGSSLIKMYAHCGCIEDAHTVFKKMPARDVVIWNAMILGYVKCGHGRKALELSQQMQQLGLEPSTVTFVGILNACAVLVALKEGRRVHEQIIQRSLESDVFVASSLIDMYAKCGSVEEAQLVFNKMPTRDVVAWNAIILGHVKCGEWQKALDLSERMQQDGLEPSSVTFVGILNACASLGALKEGRRVHDQVIQRGWESNIFVGSSLVDMYVKCGSIEDAQTVFTKMPVHDVVAWTAMIQGHVKFGDGQKALELFQQMEKDGAEPSTVTFVGILNACASVVALEEGRRVHEQITQRGWESDVSACNSLVDMYAKCGSLEDATKVFEAMPRRDAVAWTAMIAGHAMHGHAKEAAQHFEWMCQEGVEVDGVVFLPLLSAFSHGRLVNEGLHYFESMSSIYRIVPTVDHYACVVDLLCRAGHLHEAENLIRTMPCEPNVSVWTTLLGACRVHGSVEMGERVAKCLFKVDPANTTGHVLLSNIYAAAGRWESSAHIQRERLELR